MEIADWKASDLLRRRYAMFITVRIMVKPGQCEPKLFIVGKLGR